MLMLMLLSFICWTVCISYVVSGKVLWSPEL